MVERRHAMITGPDELGPGAVMVWGIVVGVTVLVGLRRSGASVGPLD